MDSSPLDWGYHLPPCSTTFNQAPLWSLPISSRPSLKLSASIRSCRQAWRARLRSALVNYYRLVKPQCLPCQRGQEKWTHFYAHALTYLRSHGRAGGLGHKPWIQRRTVLFCNSHPPNNGQGLIICSVFGIFWCRAYSDPLFPCCSAEVRRCVPAELCLHLCPYRINKAILVCSEVKYTNLECCGGTFNHYLLMFRPVKSIMSSVQW